MIRLIVAALLAFAFFAGSAQAAHKRHHWQHHHSHHVKAHKAHGRHWHGHGERQPVPAPVQAEGWHTPASGLVAVAERYLGGNPTGWAHNWCSQFLNAVVLPAMGLRGTGDATAISFAHWGSPSGPRPGAVAVMSHHVGIVMADHGTTVTLISGNHGHRVAIGEYPKGRILAYRTPT